MTVVVSPLTGTVVDLGDVDDPVFSGRVMGDGVAVSPSDERVLAPVDGTIERLFPGGHGMAFSTVDGVEVLVHVGLETVKLEGDGFTVHAAQGDRVAAGDLLVTIDLKRLGELGVDAVSPVVVISAHTVRALTSGTVNAGDPLLEVTASSQNGTT